MRPVQAAYVGPRVAPSGTREGRGEASTQTSEDVAGSWCAQSCSHDTDTPAKLQKDGVLRLDVRIQDGPQTRVWLLAAELSSIYIWQEGCEGCPQLLFVGISTVR